MTRAPLRFNLDLPERHLSSDDWYTPRYIFDALNTTFDLDVAAPPGGVPWVPATRHLSEADDGLSAPWHGFVWMNPPYSKPGPWLARLAEHGNGIGLVPADTASKWWHYATHATVVMFLRDRITFVQPGNESVTSARFPSALVAYGDQAAAAVLGSGLGWAVTGATT